MLSYVLLFRGIIWLFRQNKFFLVEFRSQSALSLVTCAFLFNWCPCPCSLHVIYINQVHILCLTFLECLINSFHMFFPYSTVTVLAWRNTFVFISQLHTSINKIIFKWTIRHVNRYNLSYCYSHHHYSDLMQFILKQKTQPMSYNWKLFFHSGIVAKLSLWSKICHI